MLIDSLKFIAAHPLNRGRAFASLLRFVKWQIGSRLVPGAVVHDWIAGSKFLVRRGETGVTGNLYTGLHEFADMGYVLHVLRATDLFVDVGANVGSYTILACAVAGARGYAFEPVPGTYNKLIENIRLNHLEGRVRCLNAAVGQTEGKVSFTSGLDTTNHALAAGESATNTVEVPLCALDSVLKGEMPAMMKIDVEGYETLVVAGAADTLGNPSLHSVIMELNGSGSRYGYDESAILRQMLGHGFRPYTYDPLDRRLIDLAGSTVPSGNTIFVRDLALVADRVATAAKVRILGKEF